MKTLAIAAQDYLALRRALGFKLRHETWFLPAFVAFLKAHGSTVITAKLAVQWATQPLDTTSGWWAHRLSAVRGFALHRRATDPRTEIPSSDLIPHQKRRRSPYLYSDRDVAALMREAQQLRSPLKAISYYTLIGLLAATGMRVGEALALNRGDVDWHRSLVTVHEGKFGKSRHVPLHPSTITALKAYARLRGQLSLSGREPALFVSSSGARVLHQNFHRVFRRLVKKTGIGGDSRQQPVLHDLRHTFAVKTLRNWYRQGVDVERRLPILSTYLGHVSPSSTYWYLTGTPELLALASRRSERAWGARR